PVGMLLERPIPEILRVVLPAGRKADGGSSGIAGKGERESDHQPAAVRGAALALEPQRRRERDPGGREIVRIGFGIMAFQHEEGEPLPALEKALIEAAEQRRKARAAELLGFRNGQQLEKESRQLDDMVVGAPRMPVARPYRE